MRCLLLIAFLLGHGSLHAQSNTIPLALAESAVKQAMVAFPDNEKSRRSFMYAFCEAWLDQWRCMARTSEFPRTTSRDQGYTEPSRKLGYEAGLKAVTRDFSDSNISPSDFGYVLKSIEGTYRGRFESSEFEIDATGERFHTNFGFVTELPNGKVRINVWMSPETEHGFGHFNQWKREIIIVEIEKNKS